MSTLRSFPTLIAILAIGAHASAQDSTLSRTSFTASILQSRPQGELARNIGTGYGAAATVLYSLDRAGFLSLRADVGIVQYGDEVKSTSLYGGAAGRVNLNVRTSNYIVPMSVGPQLMWPTGIVRPYINAGIGGQAYFTESHLETDQVGGVIASSTNQSDFTFAWTAGGGLYIPLPVKSKSVSFDMGVQYMNGGDARYLAQGSITDLPTGVVISPMQSNTHLLIVKFGARVGL